MHKARKIYRITSTVVFLALFSIGFAPATNTFAMSSVSDILTVTVIGDEPYISLLRASAPSGGKNKQLSVSYHFQHADFIDFSLTADDGSVLSKYYIEPAEDAIAGSGQVYFDISNIPDGSYTVTAKVNSALGNVEDTLTFSYSPQSAVLVSAILPANTISALEEKASAEDYSSLPTSPISPLDRILTSILLGLSTSIGCLFAFCKLGLIKHRTRVQDSAITFVPK